jgi:hypothetical protein
MAHDYGLLLSEVSYQARHVVGQLIHAIIFHARRLVAQIVAAHIHGYYMIAVAEGLKLVTPRIPALRKTMKQYDEMLSLAPLSIMQAYAADLRVPVTNCTFDRQYFFAHIKSQKL